MNALLRPKKDSVLPQWLYLATAVLILGSAFLLNLYTQYNAIADLERERLATQARVVDDNLADQLLATNLVLDAIRGEVATMNARRDDNGLIYRMQAMSDAMLGVRTLVLLDVEGTVIASNRKQLVGQNFQAREYFRVARAGLHPATLYVSPPFRTVLGVFAINVVKVVLNQREEFAGIVSATLDPAYFSTLMLSIRYSPDMWSVIVHGDGEQILTEPKSEAMPDLDLAKPGSFFSRHRESGNKADVFTSIIPATGEERMIAVRTIRPAELPMDKPLVLAVSRNLRSIFAPWRREVYFHVGLFGLLVLSASLGLFFQQQRQRSYKRHLAEQEAERRKAEATLRESEARFRSLTELSSDFYWETDKEHRIVQRDESHRGARESVFHQGSPIGKCRWEIPHLSPDDSGWQAHQTMLNAHLPFRDFGFSRLAVDGTERHVSISGDPVFDAAGNFTGYRGVGADITERKRIEEQVHKMAFHDTLTELPNRRLLNDRLNQAMAASKRSGHYGGLIFLDLDHLKSLNDKHGHEVGDLLLIAAADRLKSCVREIDTVARFGGDEFVVMLYSLSADRAEANARASIIAEKIRSTLAKPFALKVQHEGKVLTTIEHQCTASIGVALFVKDEASPEDILKRADAAMYRAKDAGRDAIRFFDSNA